MKVESLNFNPDFPKIVKSHTPKFNIGGKQNEFCSRSFLNALLLTARSYAYCMLDVYSGAYSEGGQAGAPPQNPADI